MKRFNVHANAQGSLKFDPLTFEVYKIERSTVFIQYVPRSFPEIRRLLLVAPASVIGFPPCINTEQVGLCGKFDPQRRHGGLACLLILIEHRLPIVKQCVARMNCIAYKTQRLVAKKPKNHGQ